MYVTGTFNEISSAVSAMTLDQRLLLALVLGAICAAIQAVIFPPSRLSTGVAQVAPTFPLLFSTCPCPRPPPQSPQLTPSIALVSVLNELFFKSESWPFGTQLPSLQSLHAGKQRARARTLKGVMHVRC
jgi:hypothetical protein